jgi:UDPglucose--hexose-1-phosphate uridylyltransferase
MFNPKDHPHRRFNPLLEEYVLVSPHRMKRPWQGQQERLPAENRPHYDPACYLCPRNTRNTGQVNPDYESTFVFTNDFAALLPDVPDAPPAQNPLMQIEGVRGTSRVICFSPRHDLTISEMDTAGIRTVIDLWVDQCAELGQVWRWVQVFENRGEVMGSSNPHPHGQIWSQDVLPNLPAKEDRSQHAYFVQHQSPLLLDYARLESASGERTIAENEEWIAVVPFWAMWPFEVLVLPKVRIRRMIDLTSVQRDALSAVLKRVLVKYDNLFEVSFPYSMGWHGAPYDGSSGDHWQLHAHFYPPLLRSATVRKFMVGYEMLAEAQRDLTAEQAADRLRSLSDIHYKEKG